MVKRYAVCCDIGGTKVLLGLVDPDGQILVRDRYLLCGPYEPGHFIRELDSHCRDLVTRAHLAWDNVVGIGCGAAVMADIDRGVILSAPNIFGSHTDIPFRDLLQETTGRSVVLEMDAYAAARGEAWRGIGAGVDYFVYVVVGTGIGAGILVNGEILRGWRGTAGEFGHTTIDPNGPLCNCGRYGCLEAMAAGPAIALRAQGAIWQGRKTVLSLLAVEDKVSPEMVFRAARQGDQVAREVVLKTIEYLAIGLSNLIHLLNPRVICLGGGVAIGGADLLLERLREEIVRRCGNWIDTDGTKIVLAALGEDAALLGVARLVWASLNDGQG